MAGKFHHVDQKTGFSDWKMSRQSGRVTDTKKISGELFSLTYGALVAQILKVILNSDALID